MRLINNMIVSTFCSSKKVANLCYITTKGIYGYILQTVQRDDDDWLR